MTRTVNEWIGATPDTPIPPRVKLRVFERSGSRCACCSRPIFTGEAWDVDHIRALINGGEHRELNLQPLLREHHRFKTKCDSALKSKTYSVRSKHLGIKSRKSRPMPGTKASGWRIPFNGKPERRHSDDR